MTRRDNALEGRVAVITGSGRNIGRCIALRLASEGAAIVVNARSNQAEVDAVVAEIRAMGGRATGCLADVTSEADVQRLIDTAVSEFGGLDILVNNASLLSDGVLLEHKTDEMLRRTLEIGVWGNWWAMLAAFPHMKARGGGSIINFSSIDAQTGAWLHSDYNINKLGIVGLTRSAAVEWGRFNIRVNAIAPTGHGQVFAQLVKDVPGFLENVVATNPLKRAGDPENDIGPVAVFLASEMSRFITGEMINVDGGQNLPGYVSIPHNLDELEKGVI
jgi:NAD(P)-dependent dehydrogenase (short-subunit alcohol dehydrogenase family)